MTDADLDWISFKATLHGKEVRLTIPYGELDIVSRDNQTSYEVEASLEHLEGITFEEAY